MPNDTNIRMVLDGQVTELHLRQLTKELQKQASLTVDGVCGPKTREVLEHMFREDDTLTDHIAVADAHTLRPTMVMSSFDGPLPALPRTRVELNEMFGNPGAGKVDAKWERTNIVKVTIPGLPRAIRTHRLVEPYIREAVRRALEACPGYRIVSAASFVFRHERWDESRPLSKHSWGVAIDINPDENELLRFKRGETPEAWSEGWMKSWPIGLPKEFVSAFQSVGFAWGADWNQDGTTTDHVDIDPMHFELVNRRPAG